MKEYRLAAWPELRPPYHRMAYRRLLSGMSQRHMTVWQLTRSSGLRRFDVQNFVEMLEARGVISERERGVVDALRESMRDCMRPLLTRWWRAPHSPGDTD
jgi:hypothetical protein